MNDPDNYELNMETLFNRAQIILNKLQAKKHKQK